jgi:hypothetical protein
MPEQQSILSPELMKRLRELALEKVAVMDELEAALQAGDEPRALELARQLCDPEREVEAA